MESGAEATLALIGAGSFARKQYLPTLIKLRDCVSLKTIWSRSQESAESAVSMINNHIPNVQSKWGDAGLADILADTSIRCVAIVLAPQLQSFYVEQALKAGKHVIQEKPVALSTVDAVQGLSRYNTLSGTKPVWAVAENYRFESGLLEAARLVKGIGQILAVEVLVESPMNASRPSFFSAWRRDLEGGYVMDGGVHYVAGLRMITGCEVKSVFSVVRHADKSLPPPDNVSALLQLDNGCTASLVISFSCTSKKMSWRVVGSNGTIEVQQVAINDVQGFMVLNYPSTGEMTQSFFPAIGVEMEVKSFVKDALSESGEVDKRSSPVEAFHDVAVMEAILKSKGTMIDVNYSFSS